MSIQLCEVQKVHSFPNFAGKRVACASGRKFGARIRVNADGKHDLYLDRSGCLTSRSGCAMMIYIMITHRQHMVRKQISITGGQNRMLKKLSDDSGLSEADHVRRALDDYFLKLEERKRKLKES